MNNVIKKIFINTYEKHIEKLGFQRKGTIFHRLVNNEILQFLSYRTYSGGREITIQFNFIPLCNGYKIDRLSGADCNLTLEKIVRDMEFINKDKNELEYLNLFAKTLDICKEAIFPFFSTVKDYQSYWDYIRIVEKIDEQINNRRHKIVYTPLNSHFYLLLKLGLYEKALLAGEADILIWTDSLQQETERENKKFEECRRYSEFFDKKMRYEKIKDMILKNNTDSINAILAEKEEYSYQSYLENFWGGTKSRVYKVI